MKNKPLYEVRIIHDLRDMLQQSVRHYGDKTAFLIKDPRVVQRDRQPENIQPDQHQSYLPVTYCQYARDVDAHATYMKRLQSEENRVAILAETRYEWYVTYMAAVNGVGIVVPLDKELPPNEIARLLNRSHANILVYAASKKKEVDALRDQLPEIQHYLCMDKPDQEKRDQFFWSWLADGEKALSEGDRKISLRDKEFEKTTSKKIRRQY